jgi:murein DD-endopeptidase MepM/ murein hydrolase activator NlpD
MINDPVYVTAPGVVTYSGWKSDYGITVIVDHGDSYKTLYAHLNRNVVKKGDFVERGQTIGMVGMTGNTSGPHLHYEIKYNQKTVNPEDYFLKSL